ncbi:MAG: phosphoribosylamine--glycine ligase [Candidatus Sabulitectum sp.]|nr:phosphoribosylamine--glycine ligase [Candidatus Sabulitectum sp.]
MRILVIGSGGREHALAWALYNGGENSVLVTPGNPGTAEFAQNISGDPIEIAVNESVDLVVVGPEVPLVNGIAGQLAEKGIPCFGPSAECARLEGSKWFAKEIMAAAGVPTANGKLFTNHASAVDYIGEYPDKFVIKADGLAAGKGVYLPNTRRESDTVIEELFKGSLGEAGASVVIEQRLSGREVSVLAVCNGTDAVVFPPSRDHKRALDGDMGPNTGGMGAICPPPDVPWDFGDDVREKVILPVLKVMKERGMEFRGVLYAGLMITEFGYFVLEFNVRFGDPETQAVLPMVKSDLAELFLAAARGEDLPPVEARDGASACIILASGGYPGSYSKGFEITGAENAASLVFHAGTAEKNDSLVTAGGRVMGVTALGDDLDEALEKAYIDADRIEFEGKHMRRDIGRTV